MKQHCLARLDGRLPCRRTKADTDTTEVAIGRTRVRLLPPLLAIVSIAATRAWFAVRFPATCTFEYVEGAIRWHTRLVGYAFALAIDECRRFPLVP